MAIAESIRTASPAVQIVAPTAKARSRYLYLDALKVVLTVLVIAHHAGQAYGPTGGRWPIFEAERAAILGPFFSVNAAFFMGLFFLISAYFVPGAFDRKGAEAFLRDRVVRFGVPLAVVGIGVFGPIAYVAYTASGGTLDLLSYVVLVYLGQWQVELAHLWFVAHLLVYAVLYAAWRTLLPQIGIPRIAPPGHVAIVAYALALGALTFVVRLEYPQDRWIRLFGIVPTEVAHLPQYASLFVIGLVAARNRWLERIPSSTGLTWLALGVAAAALRYVLPGGGQLVWSFWESVICVGLCVGLPVLFRDRLSDRGWLAKPASSAYGAYVVHIVPVVVGLQFALANVPLDPLAKFGLVTVAGVPLSFAIAAGLRRVPRARSVL
jgi:glucan biosynthesis protein C